MYEYNEHKSYGVNILIIKQVVDSNTSNLGVSFSPMLSYSL